MMDIPRDGHAPRVPEEQNSELGRLYEAQNPVPPTPSSEMWSEVARQLPVAPSRQSPIALMSRTVWAPTLRWAAAAGLVLAVGIGIGRSSVGSPRASTTIDGDDPGAVGPTEARPAAAMDSEQARRSFDALTRSRLVDVEPLLTMFAADAMGGRIDPQLTDWAAGELTRTRLALDSPGAADPAIRSLLQDLELILMQMANLGGVTEERAGEEMGLIAEALLDQGLLARVRTIRAAGP